MTPSEAFAILGLADDADEASVRDAYHELSLQKHPDRQGGSNEDQARINDAYNVALSTVAPKNTALQTTRSLQRVELALLTERSARRADSEAKAIKRRRRRRLDQLRNLALIAGIAVGILLLFADYLFEPLLETASENVRRGLKLQFGIVAVTFGAVALWMQTRVQRLENAIESFVEELSDRKLCATQLAELLSYEDRTIISEEDFFHRSDDQPPSITLGVLGYSAQLSEDDFRRILIPKAVEHRLLEPVDPQRLEPQTATQYRVLFRPSVFKPESKASPQPAKAMSKAEARGMAITGGILTAIVGAVATYLAVFHRTWWALLQGSYLWARL